MQTILSNRIAAGFLGLCAVFATGCGLAEYESKMHEEQKKIDRLDEETRLLASPLNAGQPKIDGRDAVEVYLRPPLGTSTSKEEQPWAGLFYWFKGGSKMSVDVFIGWAPADKDLKAELLKNLRVTSEPTVKTVTTTPPTGREGLQLEHIAISGANLKNYFIYIEPKRKVAVMYVVTQEKPDPQANDAVHASVNTLVLGPDAAKARKAYDELAKRLKGKGK